MMRYAYDLYDSFTQVDPVQWSRLAEGQQDLAMDLRLLDAFQRTMADQCRCWAVLFRDHAGEPVASACLCLFQVDAMASTGESTRRLVRGARTLWPGCLRFGVLFCGLPVPAGQSHLRIAPSADHDAVIRSLDEVLATLARRHHARLIAVKELDTAECRQMSTLQALGYVRGGVPPLYTLSRPFHSIEDYCRCQVGRYRRHSLRSMRKLTRARFDVECLSGDQIADRYDDAMHTLYDEVWRRSEYRLEHLGAEFLRQLARRFGTQAFLTVLHRDSRPAAFVFSLCQGPAYYAMYCGLDYALNHEGDLYFNLFYRDLDNAFHRGATQINLGQTSDGVKARLGAVAQPRYFYTRAVNPLLHRALRTFSPWVFPAVPPPPHHEVFSTAADRPQ